MVSWFNNVSYTTCRSNHVVNRLQYNIKSTLTKEFNVTSMVLQPYRRLNQCRLDPSSTRSYRVYMSRNDRVRGLTQRKPPLPAMFGFYLCPVDDPRILLQIFLELTCLNREIQVYPLAIVKHLLVNHAINFNIYQRIINKNCVACIQLHTPVCQS